MYILIHTLLQGDMEVPSQDKIQRTLRYNFAKIFQCSMAVFILFFRNYNYIPMQIYHRIFVVSWLTFILYTGISFNINENLLLVDNLTSPGIYLSIRPKNYEKTIANTILYI